MRCRAAAVIVLTCSLAPAVSARGDAGYLSPAERAAGWTVLFDGESTDAWRGYRKPGFPEQGWVVEDGALRVKTGGGGGDIITKRQFRNFELVLEYRTSAKANSGILYRVTEENPAAYMSGPEMQILDDEGHALDAHDLHSAGALYGLYRPVESKTLQTGDRFNEARIVVRDGRVKHYLNGVKLLETDMDGEAWASRVAGSKFHQWPGFGRSPVGHLCLQDHGNDVWFRHIRVRDLDAPRPGEIDLLAGNRIDQWMAFFKEGGTTEEVWSFDGDVLMCAGQPTGYLRTNADYTNFVLRLQWRFDPVTRRGGNSGVLVRMVGEDRVWPKSVEAQLHAGNAGDFWNIGDFTMTVPEERTNGRNTKKTHGNERPLGEWNDYEIIVDGGRVTLIVNDEVLNEATGVEVVPGKICLQSEGTPIHFRRVRVTEIALQAGWDRR